MQRRVMQRMFLRILAIALLVNLAVDGHGQSLGDIARENREKKNVDDPSAAPPKVITNKDLPKDPNANQGSSEATPGANAAASSATDDSAAQRSAEQRSADQRTAELRSANQRSAQQRLAEQRAADQWKRQILAQKYKMVALQARIDLINASIRSANGSAQYEGPANGYQARQMHQVAQIKQRLDEQKRKLEQMQEAARRAGVHTAVYDP
jgi:hypothetical protein